MPLLKRVTKRNSIIPSQRPRHYWIKLIEVKKKSDLNSVSPIFNLTRNRLDLTKEIKLQ